MTEHGFARTTCGCAACVDCCRQQPGPLAPGELPQIAAYLGRPVRDVLPLFWASPGALVESPFSGERRMIPTITPAMRRGRCVFLDEADRCRIHAVAPFGCAMTDTHMPAVRVAAARGLAVRQDRAQRGVPVSPPDAAAGNLMEAAMRGVRVCRFDVTGDLPRRDRDDYAKVRAYVLDAGKFSSFEASENRTSAAIFTRLCAEPDLQTFDLGFPWTGIAPAVGAPGPRGSRDLREYHRRRAVYHADRALAEVARGDGDEAGWHAYRTLKHCRRYFNHRTSR